MGPANPAQVPNYLTASSPQGLRRLMLLNNVKRGMFIKYFDIQFVSGKWFAWFYSDEETSGVKSLLTEKV